jgi:predicted peroxiredoxin
MKLGILVNTDRHEEELVGLTRAAVARGHEVNIFIMDDGVRLLTTPSVTDLCNSPGVQMSYCDYSTKQIGVSTAECHGNIVCGSQYDNATMQHEADRVIVL